MQLAGAQLAQPKLGLWELEVGGHRVGLHPQVFQLGYHLGREGGGACSGPSASDCSSGAFEA